MNIWEGRDFPRADTAVLEDGYLGECANESMSVCNDVCVC